MTRSKAIKPFSPFPPLSNSQPRCVLVTVPFVSYQQNADPIAQKISSSYVNSLSPAVSKEHARREGLQKRVV
jgi:hypothetical protein